MKKETLLTKTWAKLLALIIVFNLYFIFANIGAPFGILFFPVFLAGLPIAINFIFSGKNLHIKSLISFFLVFVSDLLLRNFAGGTHDAEGNGFLILFFIIGLVLFFISEIIFIVINPFKKENNIIRNLVLIIPLQVLLATAYFNYFRAYGMEIGVYAGTVEEAKEKNVLINEYEISKHTLINNNDTIIFNEAWLEKKIRINHKSFIKKEYETGVFNLKVEYEKTSSENRNVVEVIDDKGDVKDESFSNYIYLRYDSSVIERDSIILNINYENIKDSILLIRKTTYNI